MVLKKKRLSHIKEVVIERLLFLCSLLSVFTTGAIIFILFSESIGFFKEVPLSQFLTDTQWTPLFTNKHFGILPLLCGTFITTLIAISVAVPLGLVSAIYLSEYASDNMRSILKPVLELLAGVPTVVYGYFALTFITPLLQLIFPETQVFNAASAAIVVGIMILPMIASLSDNALTSVPESLRQGAYALGATPYEVSTRIVVPAGLSGIMASFLLAISRAIGETMAVTLAAGATPNLSLNIFEGVQTMTAYIVQVSLGDTPAGTIVYQTLFAVAGFLFIITLTLNIISQFILKRFREVYE